MSHSVFDWLTKIKAVEREFIAVRASVGLLRGSFERGSGGPPGVKLADLIAADENLEATYLVRLWAEFETAVRSYYSWLMNDPKVRIVTHDLINAVGGIRRGRAINDEVRGAVHGVREYRNTLVHAREETAPSMTLAEARHHLNTFLCKLPETWG